MIVHFNPGLLTKLHFLLPLTLRILTLGLVTDSIPMPEERPSIRLVFPGTCVP